MAEAKPIQNPNNIQGFVTDMVEFVLNDHFARPNNKVSWSSPFQKGMGETVVLFMNYFRTFFSEVASFFKKSLDEKTLTPKEFAKILINNLSDDYPFLELITTCSIFLRILIDDYDIKNENCTCYCIVLCFHKLKKAFQDEGGWTNFHLYCRIYGISLRKLIKNREAPRTVLCVTL